jgi:hypothetical protein
LSTSANPYEVVFLTVSTLVLIVSCSAVVRYDERRLTRDASLGDGRAATYLERAWPPSSRDNALIGLSLLGAPLFGLFGVGFHFFRTRSRSILVPWRWSPTGALLGIGAIALVIAIHTALLFTLAYVLGLPLED